ncbi:MAG: hypothetical protein AB1Z23_09085 [Eubacteriales bacterium]
MDILKWLNEGDASIKYWVSKYLLKENEPMCEKHRQQIHKSGWVKGLIDLWDADTKMWGGGIYSPKWISTTYTMLDIKNFDADPSIPCYQESAKLLLDKLWISRDPSKEYPLDLCICGFLLSLCCYGKLEHSAINDIVDTLLEYHMEDGAWNCDLVHDPSHSSLHTTINVLEGFLEYKRNGYTHRIDEVDRAVSDAHEFILCHRLYKSDKTRQVIKKSFTMLSYPCRWKYDVLRSMVYFADYGVEYDERMDDAIEIIKKKQNKDGTWPVQQKYSGQVHFDYEETGKASRINTVRAMRVLGYYQKLEDNILVE